MILKSNPRCFTMIHDGHNNRDGQLNRDQEEWKLNLPHPLFEDLFSLTTSVSLLLTAIISFRDSKHFFHAPVTSCYCHHLPKTMSAAGTDTNESISESANQITESIKECRMMTETIKEFDTRITESIRQFLEREKEKIQKSPERVKRYAMQTFNNSLASWVIHPFEYTLITVSLPHFSKKYDVAFTNEKTVFSRKCSM